MTTVPTAAYGQKSPREIDNAVCAYNGAGGVAHITIGALSNIYHVITELGASVSCTVAPGAQILPQVLTDNGGASFIHNYHLCLQNLAGDRDKVNVSGLKIITALAAQVEWYGIAGGVANIAPTVNISWFDVRQ